MKTATTTDRTGEGAPPGVFHCRRAEWSSPAQRAGGIVLLGALLGGVAWAGFDFTISALHIAGWLAGGIAVVAPVVWFGTRNPVLSIGIDDAGLTIERTAGTRTIPWGDVEAARFQDYAMPNTGGQVIRCLLVRAGGKTLELTPEFADAETGDAFEEALFRELEYRDIPETSPALPSFARVLSLAGAWTFAAAIGGLLAAHAAGYHTIGTIVGVSFLLTGSVIAWMTRRQRISRIVLAATAVLIVGGGTILWACRVNVREALNRWEWTERQR
jgi:hypothetical protein